MQSELEGTGQLVAPKPCLACKKGNLVPFAGPYRALEYRGSVKESYIAECDVCGLVEVSHQVGLRNGWGAHWKTTLHDSNRRPAVGPGAPYGPHPYVHQPLIVVSVQLGRMVFLRRIPDIPGRKAAAVQRALSAMFEDVIKRVPPAMEEPGWDVPLSSAHQTEGEPSGDNA